jgi:Tfp pilus assembly protein PilN
VAGLTLDERGYAMSLAHTGTGLCDETEEKFAVSDLNLSLALALKNFKRFVEASDVSEELGPVNRLVICAAPALRAALLEQLSQHGLSHLPLDEVRIDDTHLSPPEAVALGLLLVEPTIPLIDLSTGLEEQIQALAQVEAETKESQAREGKKAALYALVIPLVMAVTLLSGAWAGRSIQSARLRQALSVEQERARQLATAQRDYEAAQANFAVLTGLVRQIISLKEQQPNTYRMLLALDDRYPKDDWALRELNCKGNQVELKGRTRREENITSFIAALETSERFNNITTIKNLVEAGGAPGALPLTLRPNLSELEFTIKATYLGELPASVKGVAQ